MITINYCLHCEAQFLLPREYTDCLDTTCFVCPECLSKHWIKLDDSTVLSENQIKSEPIQFSNRMKPELLYD